MRFIIALALAAALVYISGPANADDQGAGAAVLVSHAMVEIYASDDIKPWAQASVSSLALVADWLTTLDIERANNERRNGHGWKEIGGAKQFIGEHPSRGAVNRYFAGLIALDWLSNYVIEKTAPEWAKTTLRLSVNGGISLTHATAAAHNVSIGLSLSREF